MYFMGDIYPTMGSIETSTTVQPDEEAQNTLVDDAQVKQDNNIAGANKTRIFGAILIIIALSLFGGIISKG